MARFRYAALTPAGRLERGLVEAESREDALRALAARGETATELRPAPETRSALASFVGGGSAIAREELGPSSRTSPP